MDHRKIFGQDKRLAEYLGVSEEKARELLQEYRKSHIYLVDPSPGSYEKALFQLIKDGEEAKYEKKKRKRGEIMPDLTADETTKKYRELLKRLFPPKNEEDEKNKDS